MWGFNTALYLLRNLSFLLESDLSMRRHVAWTVGWCFRQLSLYHGAVSCRRLLGLQRRLHMSPLLSLLGWPAETACSPERLYACLLDGLHAVGAQCRGKAICNRKCI